MLELIGAFLLGSVVVYFLQRGEILRLRDQNTDLLGSLYARIGYKPSSQNPKSDVTPQPTPLPADSISFPKEKYSSGVPDLFERQREAKRESEKKQLLYEPNDLGGLTVEQFQTLPREEQLKIVPMDD